MMDDDDEQKHAVQANKKALSSMVASWMGMDDDDDDEDGNGGDAKPKTIKSTRAEEIRSRPSKYVITRRSAATFRFRFVARGRLIFAGGCTRARSLQARSGSVVRLARGSGKEAEGGAAACAEVDKEEKG